jgi:hypothetical protein
MKIYWSKLKPSDRIIDQFQPNAKGSISLQELRVDILKSWKNYTKYHATYALNAISNCFGAKFDFYKLTKGDLDKAVKNFDIHIQNRCCQSIGKIARWHLGLPLATNNLLDPSKYEKGSSSVKLEIQAAKENDLIDFIESGRYNGIFGQLKLSVLESILDCAPDEFRIIPWSKLMIDNDDERQRVLNAIRDVLHNEPLIKHHEWACKQSFRKKAFYIVRPGQLNRIKQLASKGGVNAARLSSRNGGDGEKRTDKSKDKPER